MTPVRSDARLSTFMQHIAVGVPVVITTFAVERRRGEQALRLEPDDSADRVAATLDFENETTSSRSRVRIRRHALVKEFARRTGTGSVPRADSAAAVYAFDARPRDRETSWGGHGGESANQLGRVIVAHRMIELRESRNGRDERSRHE